MLMVISPARAVRAASRLSHAELSSPTEMYADCEVVEQRLSHLAQAPSMRYEDYPREVPKQEIRVSDAAAQLAAALHLHLD